MLLLFVKYFIKFFFCLATFSTVTSLCSHTGQYAIYFLFKLKDNTMERKEGSLKFCFINSKAVYFILLVKTYVYLNSIA